MAQGPVETEYSSDGRVRRGQKTREELIRVASHCFADRGYNQTSVREIASIVGVDKALVIRHFGSKEKLFTSCVEAGTLPAEDSEQFTNDPHRLTERVVGIQGPDSRYAMLLACVRSAGTQETNDLVREVLEDRAMRPASLAHGADRSTERVALVTAVSLGLLLTRNVLGMEALQAMSDEELIGWLEPVYAQLLNGPAPQTGT